MGFNFLHHSSWDIFIVVFKLFLRKNFLCWFYLKAASAVTKGCPGAACSYINMKSCWNLFVEICKKIINARLSKILKRYSSTRLSASVFFYESTTYGPLIHTLKYFRIRFRIHADVRICICISAVGYNPDSKLFEDR
jgi:hypothetical protein